MRMFQDGVEVGVLPDCAMCTLDDELRSPFYIDECPIGEEDFCPEDCPYYGEDWDGSIRKAKERSDE